MSLYGSSNPKDNTNRPFSRLLKKGLAIVLEHDSF